MNGLLPEPSRSGLRWFGLALLAAVCLWAGIIYVVWHFAAKFW